jgi:predicted nucleic acid-binding protein
MMVLVDTPLWSFFLRRHPNDLSSPERRLIQNFEELIREGRVQLLGSTRQEVLSGILEDAHFKRIRMYLRAFKDVALTSDDYELAAEMSNQCRRSGIAASAIDMLICAVSGRRRWQVFSTDRDFLHYRRVLDIQLLPVS